MDAADLADKVQIHWRSAWSTEATAGTIRKFAAGDFENSGSWYEARLDPERLSTPLLAAKELQCSADFLLGLTEDIHGGRQAVGWRPGTETPDRDGQEVIARFSADGLQTPVRMMARWSGGRWCFQSGEPMEATCVKWYPIPEEEQ